MGNSKEKWKWEFKKSKGLIFYTLKYFRFAKKIAEVVESPLKPFTQLA